MKIVARIYVSADVSVGLPMRLGITVVFLGHDGRRWFGIAQTRGLLSSPSASCSLSFGCDMRPRWLLLVPTLR